MKRSIIIICVLAIFILVATNIFASGVFSSGDIQDALNENSGSPTLNAATRGAWSLIKNILQVTSIGVVIFCGVRYMMSSAEQKADIKKSMVPLVIGATIVFASTTVIEFIVKVADEFF